MFIERDNTEYNVLISPLRKDPQADGVSNKGLHLYMVNGNHLVSS